MRCDRTSACSRDGAVTALSRCCCCCRCCCCLDSDDLLDVPLPRCLTRLIQRAQLLLPRRPLLRPLLLLPAMRLRLQSNLPGVDSHASTANELPSACAPSSFSATRATASRRASLAGSRKATRAAGRSTSSRRRRRSCCGSTATAGSSTGRCCTSIYSPWRMQTQKQTSQTLVSGRENSSNEKKKEKKKKRKKTKKDRMRKKTKEQKQQVRPKRVARYFCLMYVTKSIESQMRYSLSVILFNVANAASRGRLISRSRSRSPWRRSCRLFWLMRKIANRVQLRVR